MATRGAGVVCFADEEDHFGPFFGSCSFTGSPADKMIDAAEDRSGRGSLRHCMEQTGLAGRARLLIDPSRYDAFFEAHIEQRPRLENEGPSIGLVASIVASWRYRIEIGGQPNCVGQQNHAGTTTMAERKDAGRTMLEVWKRIVDAFSSVAGPDSVWTAGRIELEPGGSSIIPGEVVLWFQHRDADVAILERALRAVKDAVGQLDLVGGRGTETACWAYMPKSITFRMACRLPMVMVVPPGAGTACRPRKRCSGRGRSSGPRPALWNGAGRVAGRRRPWSCCT